MNSKKKKGGGRNEWETNEKQGKTDWLTPTILPLPSSNDRLKVMKEKAFLISQALDDAKVDAASSGLCYEGFKKLIAEVKKPRIDNESGKYWFMDEWRQISLVIWKDVGRLIKNKKFFESSRWGWQAQASDQGGLHQGEEEEA